MVEFQLLAEDKEYRQAYFRDNDLDKTLQFVKMVDELIAGDPEIRSVMDIGVRFAYPDHVLASRHPEVKFIGVYFMPNLAEFNAEFAPDNLQFESGYALELLESGRIGADVTIFSATAIAIRNAELREYVRVLSSRSKCIIFNEIIYPLPGGLYIDPKSLPIGKSVATLVQPVPRAGHTGPVCKTHNFAGILAGILRDAGYELVRDRVFQPAWTAQFVVQAIGRKSPSARAECLLAAPVNPLGGRSAVIMPGYIAPCIFDTVQNARPWMQFAGGTSSRLARMIRPMMEETQRLS